jgi:hypothetical protein
MNTQAIAEALKQVLAEIQKADGEMLKGGRGVKVEAEVVPEGSDGPAMQDECAECAAGTCTNPDHMDDAALDDMAKEY